MSLRCLFGHHEPGGFVGRGNVLHVKCCRCNRISTGVVIDGEPPHVTQPVILPPPQIRRGISWLKAVYVKSGTEAG